MKKLLLSVFAGVTLLTSGLTQAGECKWETVIDVNRWYSSYQVPEARNVNVVQILQQRFVVFDDLKMILDTQGSGINSVNQGQSLYSIINSIGKHYVGHVATVELEDRRGFLVEKDIYEVVEVEDFYTNCRTKEERGRLLK